MPAHRNFDAEMKPIPKEGPTFELGGETFHCLPMPPGGVIARLDGSGMNVANWIRDCLLEHAEVTSHTEEGGTTTVLEDVDDVERWNALMVDKDRPVPVQQLIDILSWLNEEYGERPTRLSRR